MFAEKAASANDERPYELEYGECLKLFTKADDAKNRLLSHQS